MKYYFALDCKYFTFTNILANRQFIRDLSVITAVTTTDHFIKKSDLVTSI